MSSISGNPRPVCSKSWTCVRWFMSTTISRMRSAAAWIWVMRSRASGRRVGSSRSMARRPRISVSGLLISWAAALASRAMLRSSSASFCSVMSMSVVSKSARGGPQPANHVREHPDEPPVATAKLELDVDGGPLRLDPLEKLVTLLRLGVEPADVHRQHVGRALEAEDPRKGLVAVQDAPVREGQAHPGGVAREHGAVALLRLLQLRGPGLQERHGLAQGPGHPRELGEPEFRELRHRLASAEGTERARQLAQAVGKLPPGQVGETEREREGADRGCR